ncbi:MAG: SDR family oxidoreductase [Anaerolineae bacterium]|jgi:NAD(P)-dependent dehydrogenase (short-subunit alcohol dehydrogenase family)|nr:SDR family oxidoreductase [Anaerolineae bacterium]
MFQDKVYLITGGANGIGLATAQALKRRGAQLAIWDVDATCLENAGRDLGAYTEIIDVAHPESVQRGVTQLIAKFGRLDGVIHSAGIARGGVFDEMSLEQHRRVLEVNLFGTLTITHSTLKHLRPTGGALVLISSVSAFYGPPEFHSYAASKAGVLNFGEGLRVELHDTGVYVGVVCPYFTDTALYRNEANKARLARVDSPLNELGKPEVVAEAILRGIEKREFLVLPTWRARLIYWLSRYGAFLGARFMLNTWLKAQREVKEA